MFYIDGKQLDVNAKTVEAEHYRELKRRILEEYEWPIIIKTRKRPTINPTGIQEPPQTISLPASSMYEVDNSMREWRVVESHPTIVKGIQVFPGGNRINISDTAVFNRETPSDVDKAIFLMFISQHGVSYSNMIYHEDRKAEAKKYVQSKAQMSAVNYYLYDDDSPLDEESIRTLALSLGISKADDEKFSIDQVKMEIENTISRGEQTGDRYMNYKAFKEHVNLGDHVIMLANIQRLYDNNVVMFDDVHCDFWLMDEEGKKMERFYKISSQDIYRKDKLLMQWLKVNPVYQETLYSRLGIKNTEKEKPTEEYLAGLDWNTLRFIAKKRKIPSYGKDRKLLEKEIYNSYQ